MRVYMVTNYAFLTLIESLTKVQCNIIVMTYSTSASRPYAAI